MGIGLFTIYDKTIEKQLISYAEMTLNGSALYLDTMAKSTKDLLDSISLDVEVSKLLNYETLALPDISNGLRRLARYEDSNYFVDSIYLYNRKNDTVFVTSPHMTDVQYVGESFPDVGAKGILSKYSGINNMEPIFRTFIAEYPAETEYGFVSFLRYNTLEKENESNVIMVNIRQELLSALVNKNTDFGVGLLILKDDKDNVRVISGYDNNTDSLIGDCLKALEKDKGSFILSSGGKKYITTQKRVFNDAFSLIFIVNEKVFASLSNSRNFVVSVSFFISIIVICILIAIVISRRLWQKMREEKERQVREEEEKEKIIEANKRTMLLSLLHGDVEIEDTEFLTKAEEEVILLIVLIEYYQSNVTSLYEKATDRFVLKEKILDVLREKFSNSIFSTFEDDGRCIIVLPANMAYKYEEKRKEISHETQLTFSFFVSEPVVLKCLAEKYDYICSLLPTKKIIGQSQVITETMLIEHETAAKISCDEDIRKMQDNILKLDMSEALLALSRILEKIKQESFRDSEEVLISTAMMIEDTLGKIQKNNGFDKNYLEVSLVHSFLDAEYLDEIYEIVNDLLQKTEEDIAGSKNSRQSELVNKMKNSINTHFTDKNFSINDVASDLQMTSAYLGKVFKNNEGVSFNTYLLNIRMEEAKHYLSDTDMPIDSVVSSSGFNDTTYFYKLFKQLNGCTPTIYRRENQTN